MSERKLVVPSLYDLGIRVVFHNFIENNPIDIKNLPDPIIYELIQQVCISVSLFVFTKMKNFHVIDS